MATDKITVIGLDKFLAAMKEYPVIFERAAKKDIGSFAEKTKKGVQSRITNAPRVDLAELLHGMNVQMQTTRNGVEFTVKPSTAADRYAIFVEEDTRPHFPPIRALQGWADRHNIPVYAVAKKIARDGTTGIHMFAEEFRVVMGNAQKEANRLGQDIVVELARHLP